MLRTRLRKQSFSVHNAEPLRVLDLGPGFGGRSLPKPQSASDPCVAADRNFIERRRGLRYRGWTRAALRVVVRVWGLATERAPGLNPLSGIRAIRDPGSGFQAPRLPQTPKLADQACCPSSLAKLAGEDCWRRWLATLAG